MEFPHMHQTTRSRHQGPMSYRRINDQIFLSKSPLGRLKRLVGVGETETRRQYPSLASICHQPQPATDAAETPVAAHRKTVSCPDQITS